MSNWKECISQSVGAVRIGDISRFTFCAPYNNKSPIDIFYAELQNIVSVSTPTNLQNGWIGSLYLISIVSNTENYFREILSRIIKICSVSQKQTYSQSISIGSVIWHSKDEVERGAFEAISLASAENIITTVKKYVGIDLKKTNVTSILEEFDKICELRHGIVHAGSTIAGKNGIKLQLPSTNQVTKVKIGYPEIQIVIDVCMTLIVEVNKILFRETSKRWAIDWRREPSWTSCDENKLFTEIWNIFHSERDAGNNTISNKLSKTRCKNEIKSEYNI